MININIGAALTLKTSYAQVEKQILNALKEELNTKLIKTAHIIQYRLRKILVTSITTTPEYRSLLGGSLQSELGVTSTNRRLDKIVQTFAENIKIKLEKMRVQAGNISGGLNIDVLQYNYKDVLSLPEARYVTDKGVVIEWLQWLLLEGDKMIVRNYQIGLNQSPNARTGLGQIMIKGGTWRVPPQFSGTRENNFITRALDGAMSDIDKMINEELNK